MNFEISLCLSSTPARFENTLQVIHNTQYLHELYNISFAFSLNTHLEVGLLKC